MCLDCQRLANGVAIGTSVSLVNKTSLRGLATRININLKMSENKSFFIPSSVIYH